MKEGEVRRGATNGDAVVDQDCTCKRLPMRYPPERCWRSIFGLRNAFSARRFALACCEMQALRTGELRRGSTR